MTTGTKCCEHHREGLPYCVDCEMESDQLREKLHSKLAETEQAGETLESKLAGAEIALEQARADADHWKSECNALQRMAHEARAEIKLKNEELDMFLAEQQAMGEIIERKDKLIKQMREALRLALAADICPAKNYWQTVETEHHRGECWHAKAKAALATERGE